MLDVHVHSLSIALVVKHKADVIVVVVLFNKKCSGIFETGESIVTNKHARIRILQLCYFGSLFGTIKTQIKILS